MAPNGRRPRRSLANRGARRYGSLSAHRLLEESPVRARLNRGVLVAIVAGPGSLAGSRRPNLILILTDDQRWNTLWAMPRVRELLGGHGVTFENAFVTTSYCCPSRASILTGQYSRHTGVLSNSPPDGGAPVFRDGSTLATWLHAGGYHTALVGKYLNRYGTIAPRIPPGWDTFDAISSEPETTYYNITLNENGREVRYGGSPNVYSTDVLGNLALDFVRSTRPPFFLYFAPVAPHLVAAPAPQDVGAFAHLPPPSSPSYDEADTSDKPWNGTIPPLSPRRANVISVDRRQMLQSLLELDRVVQALVETVAARGGLGDTVIAFASDNGFMWGEHRLEGKVWPYEESIRVPLVIRVPWVAPPGRTDRHMALNIDLASTFADLAGVTPGLPQDGRSLVPLLRGAGPDPPWRSAFVVEYLGHETFPESPPRFEAIRTTGYLYAEYTNGWRELYDLRRDPYELRNLAGQPGDASLQALLARRLHALLAA